MDNKPDTADVLAALRQLTLEEVEQRLAELDGERASLALLRRSLAARRRAQIRQCRHPPTLTEDHRDA